VSKPAPKPKVIYRDSFLLAAEKPHGIATYQESRGQGAAGLKEILEEQLNQRLFPVHRIDADTSGLVIFALDSRAAAAMIKLFKEQKVRKTYLAWCVGEVPAQGTFKQALKKNKSDQTESARTDYERLKLWQGFSLVRVFPFTGRFHQIRRHFGGAGHALVGDPLYGAAEKWDGFFKSAEDTRLMLLAESLEFFHPFSKKKLQLKSKEVF
jgi:tRNA pseudouridine65 synthase